MPILKKDLDQMFAQAKVTLTGVSDAGLMGALYDVLTEFLNDSSIWTQDVIFVAQPGVVSYPLAIEEGQIIRYVGAVNYGSTVPVIGAIPPAGTSPVASLMPDVGTVVLANSFNTINNLMATFVTNVSLPTDKTGLPQAPDWLLPIWHTGILAGLLGTLMLQPNKTYSDPKLAPYHLKRFRDAIGRARVSKLRANTNGAQAWRYPQSFRASGQQGGVPAVGRS